jgi:hypothetical protein
MTLAPLLTEDDGHRYCACGQHEYDAFGRFGWPPCMERECDPCGKRALLTKSNDGISDVCVDCKTKEEKS